MSDSLSSGLPLHTGRHLSARHKGSADNLAKRMLERLQRQYDKDLINDSNLLKSISKIEDILRFGLRNNRLRLQSTDPHYK